MQQECMNLLSDLVGITISYKNITCLPAIPLDIETFMLNVYNRYSSPE